MRHADRQARRALTEGLSRKPLRDEEVAGRPPDLHMALLPLPSGRFVSTPPPHERVCGLKSGAGTGPAFYPN